MVHLWRRTKDETETSKSAPGVGATGDIAVIVDGKKLLLIVSGAESSIPSMLFEYTMSF